MSSKLKLRFESSRGLQPARTWPAICRQTQIGEVSQVIDPACLCAPG